MLKVAPVLDSVAAEVLTPSDTELNIRPALLAPFAHSVACSYADKHQPDNIPVLSIHATITSASGWLIEVLVTLRAPIVK